MAVSSLMRSYGLNPKSPVAAWRASGGQTRAVMEGVLGELNIFSLLDQRAKDDFHVETSEVITKA